MIAGIPLALVIIMLLTWMYGLVAHSDIEHYSEKSNVVLGRTMANVLWPQIRGLMHSADKNADFDKSWLSMAQIVMDEAVLELIRETNVLAVELHNMEGYTLYSTLKDHSESQHPDKLGIVLESSKGKLLTHISQYREFRFRNGKVVKDRYILSSFLPVADQSGTAVVAVFEVYSDVTDQYDKVKQSQLRFATVLAGVFFSIYIIVYFLIRHLDKMIRDNINLRVTVESEKDANIAKSQFLAKMSHELRTPLNAIIGYSELLAEDCEVNGDEETIDDLEKIHAAANHLLHLINEILDLSKIEAGQMSLYFERVNVDALAREILQVIKPLVSQRKNRVSYATNGIYEVQTDAVKLRQILFNLLSNASKFTENGRLELYVTLEHQMLVVTVKDNGIGMTQEQLARLFKPFSQGDESTTRRYGGTGLGLVISKQYCEMLGGSIKVESVPGFGTEFEVRMPVQLCLGN